MTKDNIRGGGEEDILSVPADEHIINKDRPMAADNERKRRITLHLYDTDISVNIPAAEEEYYRACEKLITHVMNTYSTLFSGARSNKEIQFMAMVDIALRYVKEHERKDGIAYQDILSKLTADIDKVLK